MAKPVRPGTRTTQGQSEALQPAKQNGTLFADPVNAKQQKLDAAVDAVLTRFGDCAVKRGSDT